MALEDTGGPGIHFIRTPPDPLEVRRKLAELAQIEGAPGAEQQKIGIEQLNAQRMIQALAAQTAQGKAQLAEETRFHTASLADAQKAREAQVLNEGKKLAEETKYHTGTLGESAADRAQRATQAAESLKTSRIGDVLAHLGPQVSQTPGGLEALLAVTAPELSQKMAEAKRADMVTRAGGIVAGAKTEADVDKLVKTLPPDPTTGKPNPEMVNMAWNTWKAQHGDKAAAAALTPPPPVEATATGGAPTDGVAALTTAAGGGATEGEGWRSTPAGVTSTPAMVATEDRGLVKPSMGLVTPEGGVAPIPGATPGLYGETPTTVAAPTTTAADLGRLAAATTAMPGGALGAAAPIPSTTTPIPTVTAAPTPLHGAGSTWEAGAPASVDVDKLLQAVVGEPSMEELRRRQASQPVPGLTPYRTNQY